MKKANIISIMPMMLHHMEKKFISKNKSSKRAGRKKKDNSKRDGEEGRI